jgi:hypothetical protein
VECGATKPVWRQGQPKTGDVGDDQPVFHDGFGHDVVTDFLTAGTT